MWTKTATLSYSYLLYRARESNCKVPGKYNTALNLSLSFLLLPFYPHAVKPRISSPSSILDTLICGLQLSEGREGCRPSARDLPCALSSQSRAGRRHPRGIDWPATANHAAARRASKFFWLCRPRFRAKRDESLFLHALSSTSFFAFCQV